MTNDNFNN